MKRRALISVSDKTNILFLATELLNLGYEIISTGGTQELLSQNNISTINISEVTNFQEMLDGRVKTLHPNVHGGILAKRDDQSHLSQLQNSNIGLIDVVVVNLYPFQETIQRPNFSFEEAIENIDIGGPSMLRSAAKNFKDVLVVCDPNDYSNAISYLKNEIIDPKFRLSLSAKAFRETAFYDSLISNFLTQETGVKFPEKITFGFEKHQDLRYGENPHQDAAFYRNGIMSLNSLANCQQLQGKELSYNNIQDTNAAIRIISEFKTKAIVALKHMNPCGLGVGEDTFEVWKSCLDGDTVSIFGGIVASNVCIDKEVAEDMAKIFLEVIIAPEYTQEALDVFKKKKNLRILKAQDDFINPKELNLVSINGGVLAQDSDSLNIEDCSLVYPTITKPTQVQLEDLIIAQKVVKHVKSNAIVIVKDRKLIGVGAGQMNRVGSAKIALEWCQKISEGAVMGSDAFFPFADVVEMAYKYGIKSIVQPGGSIRDEDSIHLADEKGISMVLTNMRHFKH